MKTNINFKVLYSFVVFLVSSLTYIERVEAQDPQNSASNLGSRIETEGPNNIRLSSGSFSYNYGFSIPQGRDGVTPSLNLSYSSSGGTGVFGKGWSISVPHIQRSTRLGTPAYDNEIDQFEFVAGGGGTPLVEVYEEPGEYKLFKPMRDSSLMWIKYSFDNDIFHVLTDDGKIMEFGNGLYPYYSKYQPLTNKTFSWHLNSIRDKLGNTVDYHYQNNDAHLGVEEIRLSCSFCGSV
jgi:hypothetical protein